MADLYYPVSLLGCANLIELILLAGGFISVCIASTGYAQLIDSYPNLIRYNISQPNGTDPFSFYEIDAYLIKQADQAILMAIFALTLLTLLVQILFGLRYRYSWHRFSTIIGSLCLVYAMALLSISVLVACWEDKLRKRLSSLYLSNQFVATPNGFVKPHVGSAAAAAAFGFAACVMFLAESLIRFRRLADKVQS